VADTLSRQTSAASAMAAIAGKDTAPERIGPQRCCTNLVRDFALLLPTCRASLTWSFVRCCAVIFRTNDVTGIRHYVMRVRSTPGTNVRILSTANAARCDSGPADRASSAGWAGRVLMIWEVNYRTTTQLECAIDEIPYAPTDGRPHSKKNPKKMQGDITELGCVMSAVCRERNHPPQVKFSLPSHRAPAPPRPSPSFPFLA
jgi:G:T-mismatch repair DNA endonuclease (very short patch repair protein)